MRIGITTFGCDAGRSGIGQYTRALLREFPSQSNGDGLKVLVLDRESETFAPSGSGVTPLVVGDRFGSPGVNIAWHQLGLPALCRREKFDVMFLPAGNRRLPFRLPCPTVGTVHDFSSLHVNGKYGPSRMFYVRRVLPFLVRQLTHVITVSESSKRDIVAYAGVDSDRVTVIPLAADGAVFHPRDREACRAEIREKYGVQGPYVLYTSRLEHPGKNHVRLIRAFATLKQADAIPHQLVLAGGDWDRADVIKAEAAACGVSSDIIFAGFVPGGDLPLLYGAADLFVFPSLYEGFGLPILEAMSSGIPVACSNVSSMPDVAGDAALLFDPSDERDIEQTLRGVLCDPDVRTSFARKGLERAAQFSWATTASRTLDVIHRAASTAH